MRRYALAACLFSTITLTLAAHADTYSVTSITSVAPAAQGQTVMSQATNATVSFNTPAIVFAYNPTVSAFGVSGSLGFTIQVNTGVGTETITESGTTTSTYLPGFDSSLFTPITTTYSGPQKYNVVFTSFNSIPTGSTETITAQFFPNTAFVAGTPEPESLVLLGTGMVGIVGVARRRLFA